MWVFHGENCLEDSKRNDETSIFVVTTTGEGGPNSYSYLIFLKVQGGSVWCAVCLSQISTFEGQKKGSVFLSQPC